MLSSVTISSFSARVIFEFFETFFLVRNRYIVFQNSLLSIILFISNFCILLLNILFFLPQPIYTRVALFYISSLFISDFSFKYLLDSFDLTLATCLNFLFINVSWLKGAYLFNKLRKAEWKSKIKFLIIINFIMKIWPKYVIWEISIASLSHHFGSLFFLAQYKNRES